MNLRAVETELKYEFLYLLDFPLTMKLFVASLLLLFCFSPVIAQDKTEGDDLTDLQLRILRQDSIKSLKIYKYDIKNKGSKVDSTLILRSTFKYNGNSEIAEHREILKEKKPTIIDYTCTYNSNNQIVKRSFINLTDEKSSEIYEYQYSDKSQLLATAEYNPELTRLDITKREFNKDGKWVATFEKHDYSGLPEGKSVFKFKDSLFYDDKGRLSSRKTYNSDMSVGYSYFYEYEGPNTAETVTTIYAENDRRRIGNKTTRNQYGQITQSTESIYYNPYWTSRERKATYKVFYNSNGSINTIIAYYDGKVDDMLKYYYIK